MNFVGLKPPILGVFHNSKFPDAQRVGAWCCYFALWFPAKIFGDVTYSNSLHGSQPRCHHCFCQKNDPHYTMCVPVCVVCLLCLLTASLACAYSTVQYSTVQYSTVRSLFPKTNMCPLYSIRLADLPYWLLLVPIGSYWLLHKILSATVECPTLCLLVHRPVRKPTTVQCSTVVRCNSLPFFCLIV